MFAFMKHYSAGDGGEQPLLKVFRYGPISKTAKFRFSLIIKAIILRPFVRKISQFCWHKLWIEINLILKINLILSGSPKSCRGFCFAICCTWI